jgi:hypothetical protein
MSLSSTTSYKPGSAIFRMCFVMIWARLGTDAERLVCCGPRSGRCRSPIKLIEIVSWPNFIASAWIVAVRHAHLVSRRCRQGDGTNGTRTSFPLRMISTMNTCKC